MKKFNQSIAVVLAILGPSIIIRALSMDIMLSCVPSIAAYFKVPFSTSQWVLSVFFLGAGLGQVVMGPLADEFGRRKVLLASTLLIVITSLICSQVNNIYFLMLMRFIQGLGACGTTVVCMAIVRDLFADKTLPRVYSYFNCVVALAPLFGPLLGGLLLMQTGSWRAPFYFMTSFSVIALSINYLLVAETNPRFKKGTMFVKINIFKSYKRILSDKIFWSYTWCAVMCLSCLFSFFSMSSILLIDILSIEPNVFGYYFAVNSVMYLLGNLLSPKLQKWIGVNATILAGSLFIMLGGTLMLMLHGMHGLSAMGLLIPNFVSTFGVGFIFGPCMAGVVKNYKDIAGTASAAYGAILYCSSGLIVAGIMQLEISDAHVLGLSLLLMGLIVAIIVRKQLWFMDKPFSITQGSDQVL